MIRPILARPISNRVALAASLLLPLAVFAATWATTRHHAQQGQEWLIPVTGYDPRDLLRGHFVQYRYDWPSEAAANDGRMSFGYVHSLCIHGKTPVIDYVTASISDKPMQGEGCAITVRATVGNRREVQGLDTGILYVSQPRAIALSKQLADPKLRGFLRVKIRPDGVMRPVDMEFRRR